MTLWTADHSMMGPTCESFFKQPARAPRVGYLNICGFFCDKLGSGRRVLLPKIAVRSQNTIVLACISITAWLVVAWPFLMRRSQPSSAAQLQDTRVGKAPGSSSESLVANGLPLEIQRISRHVNPWKVLRFSGVKLLLVLLWS